MPFPLATVIDAASKVLDRILPDPGAKAQAQLELAKLAQTGELARLDADTKIATAQAEVSKVEASSGSVFVSGARPFIIWICGVVLLCHYVGRPVLAWLSGIYGWPAPPELDAGDLMTLLGAILGLGGYRTVEKLNGVARSSL